MFGHRISEDLINDLNESELYILKHINNHATEIQQMTIREFAERIAYSTATIIRFCKKLGYSGFSELKFDLKSNFKESTPTHEMNYEQTVELIVKDIRNTIRLLDPDLIDEIVDTIIQSRNIYLYGVGISSTTVEYLEKLLLSAGYFNVHRYNTQKLMKHAILSMNENDLLILTSATGEFKMSVNIIKIAKISNVKTLSISPYNKNEIALNSYYNLHYFGDLRENNGAEFTNRISTFYILHMLFESLLAKKERNHENHSTY